MGPPIEMVQCGCDVLLYIEYLAKSMVGSARNTVRLPKRHFLSRPHPDICT